MCRLPQRHSKTTESREQPMRKQLIAVTIVVGIVLVGVFGLQQPRSSAQQDPIRKQPACTIFCGDGSFYTFGLGAKPCWGGPLPAGGASDHFRSLAAEDQAAICRSVEAAGNSAAADCPAFKTLLQLCKTIPPEKKCEPPRASNTPPWFNGDPGCQNRQRGTYSSGQNRRNPRIESITISMCGEVIRFEQRDMINSSQRRPPSVYSFDVCCDTWQKAASTGSPCDARRDIDCDGTPNETDFIPFTAPTETPSDLDFFTNSPLQNLPFWKDLRWYIPSQNECKNCKWELVRVDYTCKDEVIQYQTTWKCPATGQLKKGEVGFAANRSRCPVPPKKSWP